MGGQRVKAVDCWRPLDAVSLSPAVPVALLPAPFAGPISDSVASTGLFSRLGPCSPGTSPDACSCSVLRTPYSRRHRKPAGVPGCSSHAKTCVRGMAYGPNASRLRANGSPGPGSCSCGQVADLDFIRPAGRPVTLMKALGRWLATRPPEHADRHEKSHRIPFPVFTRASMPWAAPDAGGVCLRPAHWLVLLASLLFLCCPSP